MHLGCLMARAERSSTISGIRVESGHSLLIPDLTRNAGVSSFDRSFQPFPLYLQCRRGRALLCFLTVSEPGSPKGAPLSLDSSESPQDEDRVPERTGSCSLESASLSAMASLRPCSLPTPNLCEVWHQWCWISEPHTDKSKTFFLLRHIADPGPKV